MHWLNHLCFNLFFNNLWSYLIVLRDFSWSSRWTLKCELHLWMWLFMVRFITLDDQLSLRKTKFFTSFMNGLLTKLFICILNTCMFLFLSRWINSASNYPGQKELETLCLNGGPYKVHRSWYLMSDGYMCHLPYWEGNARLHKLSRTLQLVSKNDTWVQLCIIYVHEYVQRVIKMYAYITPWPTSGVKYMQMTLVISMLYNIICSDIKMQMYHF